MITKQEAIEELQTQILMYEGIIAHIQHYKPDADISYFERKIEVVILSKLALESQMPRRADGDKECYVCPACGYEFPDIGGVNESYGESETYKFCPECGQAISYDE